MRKASFALIFLLSYAGSLVAENLSRDAVACRELVGSVRPSGEDGEPWLRWEAEADRAYRDCRGTKLPLDVRVKTLLKYGMASDVRGRSQTAISAYKEAVGLLDGAKSEYVDLLIDSLDKAACLESSQGLRSDATEHSKRALAERVKNYGAKSEAAVVGMVNLAMVHAAFKDYEKSESLVRQAVRVAKEACGPQCEALSAAYVGMQTYYELIGNDAEAEKYADLALDASPPSSTGSTKQ